MTGFSLKNLKESLDNGDFNSEEVQRIKNVVTESDGRYNEIIGKLKDNDSFKNVEEFGKLDNLVVENGEILENVAQLEKYSYNILTNLDNLFTSIELIDNRLGGRTDLHDIEFINKVLQYYKEKYTLAEDLITIKLDDKIE